MKKVLILLICSMILPFLSAQVDQSELESPDYGSVVFKSYQGPHTIINSLGDIRGIGTWMTDAAETGRKGYFNKYIMYHEADPDEKDLFGGDVLVMTASAGVDHIENLRHILSAYLEGAYDYSPQDAALLAKFITFYNAVYRGKMSYFQGNYIPAVISHLEGDKIGLAVDYREWPGNTQIVIPLSPLGRSGTSGILETDALTEDEVIESLREEEGMNLDVRKEMTELKEEEIQEEEEAIEETRQEIEEKEEEIQEEREEIAQREEAVAEKDPEDPEVAEEIEEIEEAKEELEEKEAEVEEAKEELEEREEQQEERLEQIKDEREQIAEDEQTVMEEESGKIVQTVEEEYAEAPFLLQSLNPLDPGTMTLIRVDSGETESSSSITNIHGGRFYDFAGGYLVIAGEESGNRIIGFMLLDKESLEVSASSTVAVSPFSKVTVSDDEVFAAVRHQGEWVPGRFDFELNLTGIVDDEILPHTNFTVEEGFIIYQNNRTRVKSVSLDDMTSPEN